MTDLIAISINKKFTEKSGPSQRCSSYLRIKFFAITRISSDPRLFKTLKCIEKTFLLVKLAHQNYIEEMVCDSLVIF
jgi:hypothetical protein